MPSLKTFYRFNLRLIILTIIGFLLSNPVYSQFQIKAEYSKTEPKPSKVSSAKIRLDDETQTPHTLVGGFYTTRNGFESKLMMNNKGPQPIEVLPTLYGENGAIMQLPTVTVERNSFITVNLRDWANFAGEEFRQGNIRLFHRGKDLVLGCNILVTDESRSLIFENKLSELGRFDSRRLEGIWWIPSNNTDSTIVLTNTSDEFLTVTATLMKNPHNSGSAQTFTLLPHQIKILDVREDFPQGNVFARAKVLGLSLTHDGAEESLLAWAMIKDESKGYSNIATFTNPTKNKSNQYHGAGLQLGSIGNNELEPVVVLRNTTDAKVDVNIKVPYTKQNGTKETIIVNTIKLNAQEVHQVNMQKAANLKNVQTAGIEIEYTGNPGSVIASAQSVSKSGTQVFRTLLWDARALKSASSMYPFSIEGTSSTKAYIKNAGFKDETYVSHITWGTDGEYAIPITTLRKSETVEIDVKKLRDEQIPDEWGRTIPLNVSKGQINWLLRRSDPTLEEALTNKVPLVGQALQVDTANGIHYSYFCLSCCEYVAYSYATLYPDNAKTQHPNNFQYQIFENGRDCYNNPINSKNITNHGYDWTSTNTSVATVSNGYISTTGGGQTEIKVKVQLPIYYEWGTNCGGGGGPYFAGINESKEKCIEGVRPKKLTDPAVSFSKIGFKKELSNISPLFAPDCDCFTIMDPKNLTADLKVYQVIIKRDGQPVTTSNNKTIVGERINLTAEVLPSGTLSNHSWTIPQTAIKDFVVSQDQTQGNTVAVDGLNTSSVNFVWVDGDINGNIVKSVTYNGVVNGLSVQGQASFTVLRPTTTSSAQTNATTEIGIIRGNSELHLGDPDGIPGIKFLRGLVSVPLPFTNTSWQTQWVQLYDSRNINLTLVNGQTGSTNDSGLDGCYPYAAVNSPTASDSPGFILSSPPLPSPVQSITISNTWTMWLMFKPSGANSVWVPLKKASWSWSSSATRQPDGTYIKGTSNDPSNVTFVDATQHPQWSNLIQTQRSNCSN